MFSIKSQQSKEKSEYQNDGVSLEAQEKGGRCRAWKPPI